MKDKTQISLSQRATDVALEFVHAGKFKNVIDAARFALGYVLKNYYDDFDPGTYEPEDADGSQYSFATVDNTEVDVKKLIMALYPDTETPYIYTFNLMDYGLIKLGEIIDEQGMPDIYTLC